MDTNNSVESMQKMDDAALDVVVGGGAGDVIATVAGAIAGGAIGFGLGGPAGGFAGAAIGGAAMHELVTKD